MVTSPDKIFALPSRSSSRTRIIAAALEYVCDRKQRHCDARDTIKELIAQHRARLTYPSYRTALRCGDIYTEAATSCDLATAKILLDSFTAKAQHYLEVSPR